nr:unnamed protein product [Callosobruchus analis]
MGRNLPNRLCAYSISRTRKSISVISGAFRLQLWSIRKYSWTSSLQDWRTMLAVSTRDRLHFGVSWAVWPRTILQHNLHKETSASGECPNYAKKWKRSCQGIIFTIYFCIFFDFIIKFA